MITTTPAGTLPHVPGGSRAADTDAASVPAGGAMAAFALLLDAGLDTPGAAADAKAKKETGADAQEATPACDPAALLGTIAAGFEGAAAPAHPTRAQAARVPGPLHAAAADTPAVPAAGSGTKASASAHRANEPAHDAGEPEDRPAANGTRDARETAAAPARQPAAADPAPSSPVVPAMLQHAAVPAATGHAHREQPHVDAIGGATGTAPSHIAASAPEHTAPAALPDFGAMRLSDRTKWDEGLSSRILWMTNNDVQAASIRLDPPELGPIEVRLTVTTDTGAGTLASVQFSAAHPATRDAIESALPRLHEMLRDNGISLGNASVGTGLPGHAQAFADAGGGASGQAAHHARLPEPASGAPPAANPHARRGSGLIDTFA